jgi:hypothetical protein
MTTTFEANKNLRRGNYCTLPTIDVEIVDLEKYCTNKKCGVLVRWNAKADYFGRHEHIYATECSYPQTSTTCLYCGCNDPRLVKYKQMSYSDETHCARCGGVSGYGIGD